MSARATTALALVALALALPGASGAGQSPPPAPDTTVQYRHLLSLDISRAHPYQRAYDMTVQSGDSTHAIGQRDVSFAPSVYAGQAAWLLVETRTGLVPTVDSLFLAPDMRPVHWSSALGAARLGAEFVGDSIFGATTTPAGRHSLLLVGRPDLIVSTAMIEALLPLLPLSSSWSDSAAVLAVDAVSGTVVPIELSVVGEEDVVVDSVTIRPSWIVAARGDMGSALFWVGKDGGETLRVQQPLPRHVGSIMEYRRKTLPPVVVPVVTPPIVPPQVIPPQVIPPQVIPPPAGQ